jgi:HSP20 family protein
MRNLVISPNRIRREIDRMFDDFFRSPSMSTDVDCDFMPRVNIRDSKDNVELTFELAGIDKKDIKVSVKDNTLTVSGERKFERKDEKDNYVRSEIFSGSFSRSFNLPDTVDADRITADYRNGMLVVTVAKLEEVKPKEIKVDVS